MPEEITLEEYRRLMGGRSKPRTPPKPRVALPAATREAPDAGNARRQPYCDRGWLFAQVGRELVQWAYHRDTGARVGPAERLADLLALLDAYELEGGVSSSSSTSSSASSQSR